MFQNQLLCIEGVSVAAEVEIRLDFCLPGDPGALLWVSAVAAGFPLVLPSAPWSHFLFFLILFLKKYSLIQCLLNTQPPITTFLLSKASKDEDPISLLILR